MNEFLLILQIIIIITIPLILIKFRTNKFVSILGTTGTAYLIGLILAGIIFILNKFNLKISFNKDVSEFGSHIAIGIAIPLLLFSTNLKSIKNLSKKSLGSFLLLTASVTVVSIIVGLLFENKLSVSIKLSGMAVGLYTGGTPNLNAIGNILGVDSTIIAMSNLSDMIIGGVFYMFLLLACKPLFKNFLKQNNSNYYKNVVENTLNVDVLETKNITKKPLIISILTSIVIALLGAVIGLIFWFLTGESGNMASYLVPSVMITSTVLGLLGSASKKLRETKGNNLVGHYLILVFSISLSMYMDFSKLTTTSIYIFLLFSIITIGTFILHLILSKVFHIDIDCFMITLTAGIYGPAFIPAIAKQINNEELTAVGLICGSLGYAIGTFLGTLVGYFLILI